MGCLGERKDKKARQFPLRRTPSSPTLLSQISPYETASRDESGKRKPKKRKGLSIWQQAVDYNRARRAPLYEGTEIGETQDGSLVIHQRLGGTETITVIGEEPVGDLRLKPVRHVMPSAPPPVPDNVAALARMQAAGKVRQGRSNRSADDSYEVIRANQRIPGTTVWIRGYSRWAVLPHPTELTPEGRANLQKMVAEVRAILARKKT